MTIYFHRIKFDDLELVLRLFKKEKRSLEQVLSYFEDPEVKKQIESTYDTLMPVHIQEILKMANAEQRMIGMSIIPPEEVLAELEASLLDQQTIHKKQVRWDTRLQPYMHEYEDTYALYAIPGEKLGIKRNALGAIHVPAVYIVKCKCASTDRIYFQYVPDWVGKTRDAIKAIAWTFKINDTHLTKEQYLHYMYSET